MDDTASNDASYEAEVLAANQRVHTLLAAGYDENEPHFRPENKQKVRARLSDIAAQAPSRSRLLDLGCGTGFILSLAHDLFERVDGIDATQAMLEQVDRSPGNVFVHCDVVETTPFDDATFDVVTAYSFLDHLADHRVVLQEAHRLLRPSGILYVDLIPNRHFWEEIFRAQNHPSSAQSPVVEREIKELVNHEDKLEQQFGVRPEDWRLTEPAKSGNRGFIASELEDDLTDIGFEVEVRHEWFLGQAAVMHGQSFEDADLIDGHLRSLLPVTSGLFKYLVVRGRKT